MCHAAGCQALRLPVSPPSFTQEQERNSRSLNQVENEGVPSRPCDEMAPHGYVYCTNDLTACLYPHVTGGADLSSSTRRGGVDCRSSGISEVVLSRGVFPHRFFVNFFRID